MHEYGSHIGILCTVIMRFTSSCSNAAQILCHGQIYRQPVLQEPVQEWDRTCWAHGVVITYVSFFINHDKRMATTDMNDYGVVFEPIV